MTPNVQMSTARLKCMLYIYNGTRFIGMETNIIPMYPMTMSSEFVALTMILLETHACLEIQRDLINTKQSSH